jgi:hypothetical protein
LTDCLGRLAAFLFAEIVIGTAFGVSWGVLCQWLPDQSHKNVVFFRWLILFSGGLISIFGAHLIHYEGSEDTIGRLPA